MADGRHLEGCFYCGESSCQEHFERAVEDKVAALLTALLQDGGDYYADVLEGRGYGPDWYARVDEAERLEDGKVGLRADGRKVVVGGPGGGCVGGTSGGAMGGEALRLPGRRWRRSEDGCVGRRATGSGLGESQGFRMWAHGLDLRGQLPGLVLHLAAGGDEEAPSSARGRGLRPVSLDAEEEGAVRELEALGAEVVAVVELEPIR